MCRTGEGGDTDTCDASSARDVQQASDFVRYDADGLFMLVPESTMDQDTRGSSWEQLAVQASGKDAEIG
jgi:hypothetical protein